MNKICETCDAKNRLHLCEGKDTNFKFCYRRSGNPQQTQDTITQFNTMDELKNIIQNDNEWLDVETLYVNWNYGKDSHCALALCKYDYDRFLNATGQDGGLIKDHLYPNCWICY